MKKLKENFIYNVFYQILALLIPFITIPYASRILGVNGIGEYSYTYSIVYYFMIIGLLGITNYGSREIAKVRDNKKLMNYKFCSIYYMQLL
ncbi:MAG: oligosaccharide flippase family protein, partial [Bacilli bacterium]|nr:oligosaccharide flippase family protein [Bacilli bacterium]